MLELGTIKIHIKFLCVYLKNYMRINSKVYKMKIM